MVKLLFLVLSIGILAEETWRSIVDVPSGNHKLIVFHDICDLKIGWDDFKDLFVKV